MVGKGAENCGSGSYKNSKSKVFRDTMHRNINSIYNKDEEK
jgi:hypothetical protein